METIGSVLDFLTGSLTDTKTLSPQPCYFSAQDMSDRDLAGLIAYNASVSACEKVHGLLSVSHMSPSLKP